MASNSGFNPNSVVYIGAALGTAVLVKKALKKQNEVDPFYDFNNQSIEIDSKEHIRVSTSLKNKPLVEYREEDFRTLYDVLAKGIKESGNGPCLGRRINGKGDYSWITYGEVVEQTRFVGSGLLNKGIKALNTSNIGIYSKNRPEWTITEYACYSYSLTVISLYDTYGEPSIKYILNQAEIEIVFVDSQQRIKNILNVIDQLPYLKYIIHFDDLTCSDYDSMKVPSRIELISFTDLMKLGRANPRTPVPPKPSDIATLCYTSGTTGDPKGAILTHGNIICSEAGLFYRRHRPYLNIPGCDSFAKPVIHYSYLPLAHMIERFSIMGVLVRGGRIGFISGDITSISEDCQLLKPTAFPFVPRILNKIYDKVKTEAGKSKVKTYLLNRAVAAKEADRLRGIIRRDTIYDKLIFKKIRDTFGGCIDRTGTGSAPITNEVLRFCTAAFSCPIPENYGQTESTFAITGCHPLEPQLGHAGPPLENVMIKLVDIPEMGYYAKDGKGEICAKGPTVFKGYFKLPDKTAEAIDQDGWLHTGDVGMWLPNGCLKIIDRKKHIFKLSQGEYISPEKVESVYTRSQFIGQIFVDGDSLKDNVIAIIVPNEENLLNYAKLNNINGNFKELCKNKIIKSVILNDINKISRDCDLMHYERIKNIYLHNEAFTLENNFITPTMKLKRNELRKYFKEIIKNLYIEIEATKSKL